MDQPGPIPNNQGLIRVFTGTDPAAGAEIQENVPTNSRLRLMSIRFGFTTDATVATRQVSLLIFSATTVFRIIAQPTQAASLAIGYNFIAGGPDRATVVQSEAIVQIPLNLLINDAFSIQTQTTNMQAGDNYGAPEIFVEEWMEE